MKLKRKELKKLEEKKIIPGLTYIQCGYALFRNWDADIEEDGIEITLVFNDDKNRRINFEDIPVSIEVKLYAGVFKDEYIAKGRLLYTGVFERTNTEELGMLQGTNPIRVLAEEISADPSQDFPFGVLELRVTTPAQGTFAAHHEGVRLYRKEY